ncbi:DoxX family protein [Candidatus Halobonum tyrrellensis]|uniref:DoxX family protein n=1 Tax=Candidatus Halobonum tyrrellensis G22 TaxID=1324957 RepID=V4GS59_9EURY|nr:DoxX family protein [Candidatus Halobonum tyrrellensis]ESP87911.1 DoxX family protein [Candidatus Halobonum tyrrellensis G22]
MAYSETNPLANEFGFDVDGPLAAGWIALLRVVTGWWFFHSGVTKLIESGLNYTYAPTYLRGMTGTALGPLPVLMGENLAWLVRPGVPLFETLIGLALITGALVRLASVGGAFFMTLFWVGNAEFGHGLVNGDLMGLLLFGTMIVFGAGRYFGLDGLLETTGIVENYPTLRYLLG